MEDSTTNTHRTPDDPPSLAPKAAAEDRVLALLALPFWNASEARLRTLWRFLLVAASTFLLGMFGRFVLETLGMTGSEWLPQVFLRGFLGGSGLVISVLLVGRLLDRRPASGFGLGCDRAWWTDCGFGLCLGAFLMTAAFFVQWQAGWVSVVDTYVGAPPGAPFVPAFLIPLTMFCFVGFYEELVFRGFILRNLSEGLRSRWLGPQAAITLSLLGSSALFGLGHASNPNATLISSVNIGMAGVFLALGFVLTGRLGLSVGLHITWNLFQGPVYGFPVSGFKVPGARFLSIEQGGPDLWTGGAFGPEAGLIGLCLMFTGCGLTVLWVRLREGRVAVQVVLAQAPVPRGKKALARAAADPSPTPSSGTA